MILNQYKVSMKPSPDQYFLAKSFQHLIEFLNESEDFFDERITNIQMLEYAINLVGQFDEIDALKIEKLRDMDLFDLPNEEIQTLSDSFFDLLVEGEGITHPIYMLNFAFKLLSVMIKEVRLEQKKCGIKWTEDRIFNFLQSRITDEIPF